MSKSHPFTLGVIVAGGRGAPLGPRRPNALPEVGGTTPPTRGGVRRRLAAAYAPVAGAALAASLARGERAVTAASLALDPRIVGESELSRLEGGSGCFFNLNTPADRAEAERLLVAPAPAPAPGARRIT